MVTFTVGGLGDKDQLTLSSASVGGSTDKAMLSSSLLQGAIRMTMLQPYSPEEALSDLNEVLWSSTPDSDGVSIFFGQLDLESGAIEFATAGATGRVYSATARMGADCRG